MKSREARGPIRIGPMARDRMVRCLQQCLDQCMLSISTGVRAISVPRANFFLCQGWDVRPWWPWCVAAASQRCSFPNAATQLWFDGLASAMRDCVLNGSCKLSTSSCLALMESNFEHTVCAQSLTQPLSIMCLESHIGLQPPNLP